jgi:hypothetical protein
MDFIQKLEDILPSRDRRFKDESLIFPTSINMSQSFRKFWDFLLQKWLKSWFPTHSQAIFFKLKIQTAQFLSWISSLDAKHKKKAKKCVSLTSYDTLSDWWKSCFLQKKKNAGFMTHPSINGTASRSKNLRWKFFLDPQKGMKIIKT